MPDNGSDQVSECGKAGSLYGLGVMEELDPAWAESPGIHANLDLTPIHLSAPDGQGYRRSPARRVAARCELKVARSLGALAWFPQVVAEGWTLHQTLIGTQPPQIQVLEAGVREA